MASDALALQWLSHSDPSLLPLDRDVETRLVACERRQQMRQQLIAAQLSDDAVWRRL